MEKGAAVIVTYNRKDLLLRCIEAIQAQTRKDLLDILVIDNHSTDGTRDALMGLVAVGRDGRDETQATSPASAMVDGHSLIYLDTGANLGGAGGFSFGVRQAVERGYPWLWLMDDDTIPTPTALEELLKADELLKTDGRLMTAELPKADERLKPAELEKAYGFLSSKVLWTDDSICTMNIQKETKWKRMKEFDRQKPIQYASFVSLFLRSETVRQVGLPYKDFFIWADDWEYTRRISKRCPCYYVPTSVVHHFCKTNVGADIVSAPAERIDRFNYMYRNDVVMYRQDGLEGALYLWIRNLTHRLRILMKSDHKKQKWAIIRKGTREGKKFRPAIEYPSRPSAEAVRRDGSPGPQRGRKE